MSDTTQWCYALTLDHAWHVTANTASPNGYYSNEPKQLAQWLLDGHRPTCGKACDLDAVRRLVAQERVKV